LALDGTQQGSMEDGRGGLCPGADHKKLLKEEEEDSEFLARWLVSMYSNMVVFTIKDNNSSSV